jgi:tetratricopeptide (TPR) repeat protein
VQAGKGIVVNRNISPIKFVLALLVVILVIPISCYAVEPYNNYSYTYNKDLGIDSYPYLEPQAYKPAKILNGELFPGGSLKNPSDIFISQSGDIYLADTGNNRILVLNDQFEFKSEISSYEIDGVTETLSEPKGIFVNSDGTLYIADTGNKRIVELNFEGVCQRIIGPPKHKLIAENYEYKPTKVVLDHSGRLYVVSEGENQGILEFDRLGNFNNFYGAIVVNNPNIASMFWKLIFTQDQIIRTQKTIPTEYSSIDIDSSGFIYGTVSATANMTNYVRKLNPIGNNILLFDTKRPPAGDLYYEYDERIPLTSKLVDVAIGKYDIYSLLDQQKGRIFTYDWSGNLLFVFGAYGEQYGTFGQPVAIDVNSRGDILVVDSKYNQVVVFSPTAYAKLIYGAVEAQYNRDYENSAAAWSRVMQYSIKSEMPYMGMGKVLMRQKRYEEAMRYFKLAQNPDYYSEAYKLFRQQKMFDQFPYIAGTAVLLCIAIIIYLSVKKKGIAVSVKSNKYSLLWSRLKFSIKVIFHPFNGFWDLKREKIGTIQSATILLLALIGTNIIKNKYTGFIINPSSSDIPIYKEILMIIFPVLLWCLANWCITTLVDGEGSFTDIYITTSYALTPLLIMNVPLVLLSNILTKQEAQVYNLITSITIVWVAFLIFIGIMTVHQFSLKKTVFTIVAAIIGMAIITFLAMLFFSLLKQLLQFFYLVYNEISLRFS